MQKLTIPFLFLSLFFINPGFAQIEIEFEDTEVEEPAPAAVDNTPVLDNSMSLTNKASVEESDESMAKGIQPVLILTLEVSDKKLTNKVWKDFMKDYNGKTKKAKGGNGENLTAAIEMVAINGVQPVDVYSKSVAGVSGNTEFLVWFDLGDDFLDGTNRKAYNEAEAMLLKFAHEVKIEHTRKELKDSEKKLKDLNNGLGRLERQHEGYHRDIAEAEKRIETAKANILTNEGQQADAAEKIELQKMLIEEIDRRLAELRKL